MVSASRSAARAAAIVAPAQLELAEPVQGVRHVGPLLAGAPRRQGVTIQRLGAGEVPGEAREPGEVHEVASRRSHPGLPAG